MLLGFMSNNEKRDQISIFGIGLVISGIMSLAIGISLKVLDVSHGIGILDVEMGSVNKSITISKDRILKISILGGSILTAVGTLCLAFVKGNK